MRRKDLTGKVFGKLTVIEYAFSKYRKAYWNCRCECGNKRVISAGNLNSGHSSSCGCSRAKHRMINSPEYLSWRSMKSRCLNKNHTFYKHYGGKGITIFHRWIDDFKAFYEDMGPRPKGTSLDRINGSKGYNPENCRWASRSLQSHNRKPTNKLGHTGVYKKCRRYRARIRVKGRVTHLGTFDTIKEAAEAYKEAALKYYGTKT